MAVVALDRLAPLADHPLDRGAGEAVGRRHLFPDQQAEAVGPVQVARVLDLLVLAHAVEAHRLGQLDVAAQRVVVRRRQQRVGPVALVEHHAQQVRPAVEHEAIAQDRRPSAARCTSANSSITSSPREQLHGRVEQGRPLGAPQQLVAEVVDAGIGRGRCAVRLAVDHLVAVARQQPLAVAQDSPRPRGRRAGRRRLAPRSRSPSVSTCGVQRILST